MEHGRAREGAKFLATCLRLASPELPAYLKSKLPKLKELYEQARSEVGSLSIVVRESGAAIAIDDQRVGEAPLNEIFVEPGTHRITIDHAEYGREEVIVTIAKGEERTIPIKLAKAQPPPKATPPPLRPVPERIPLPEKPGRSPVVIVGGASAAALGVGFGIGFASASNGRASAGAAQTPALRVDLADNCTSETNHTACVAYQDAEDERRLYRDLAVVSLVTAGLAVAATVVYVVYPSPKRKPSLGKGGAVVVTEW